ncbi:ORF185 [Saltwater crocodilepox virus]|nr:holliday junction resolvase [Saltwater crocodilepox virus]AVD69519.1 holliday junction resolvase [Saltwater crocodilepox virus]QGT46622.1 ORF185 [Saltwater crocodilepox virus]QGT46839.1 ORF185 [Saltwater crocodilepox virus]QGT47054.1 ORF185 [Saltwater crocodilepox virus]
MIIAAIDPGTRNPAVAWIEVVPGGAGGRDARVRLRALRRCDWSGRDWQRRVAADLLDPARAPRADLVVVEKQGRGSRLARVVYFVQGLVWPRATVRNPGFRGGRYADRKARSVRLFRRRAALLGVPAAALTGKLDDLADSLNLALVAAAELKFDSV